MLSSLHSHLQLNCGHYVFSVQNTLHLLFQWEHYDIVLLIVIIIVLLIHVFVNFVFVFDNFTALQDFKRRYGVFLEASLMKSAFSECHKVVDVNFVLNCESTNQFI